MRLEDINLQNPVGIGYYDPFGAFPLIEKDLLSRFPLSNLHWKYHPQQPVRSIPLLPTKLIEEVPNSRKNSASPLPSKIYSRLMFVKVEEVEVYRMQTRPLIMEWLKNSIKDKDVSWAIVMVVPGGSKATKSSLMKTSIFDKLRMDFGLEGKHLARCDVKALDQEEVQHIVKLNAVYEDDLHKLEEYNDFCTTLKALLLETFDRRYSKSSRFIEALTPQNNKVESRIKIYLERLKLAQILNDMKCFSESLELYEELSTDLKALLEDSPDKGDVSSVPFIGDLSSFSIEDSITRLDPCVQVSSFLYNGKALEPFDIKLGLFLKLSNNLQSLANFATSISISSLYIANLLRELIVIINDGLKIFSDVDEFHQWLCAMCDFHLNLPLARKLIDLDAQQDTDGSNVTEILEYAGEIKLLKRSVLDKMAFARGLELPKLQGMNLLHDVSLETNHKELKITYPAIGPFFESQHAYDESFEKLTLSAIQDFASCERMKTVDLLSIDLAFLHFKKKEYQEAFDIFQDSYEYFAQSGWKLMGGIFLELYLECLVNLEPENVGQCVLLSLRLLTALKKQEYCTEDINSFHLFKNLSQTELILKNIHLLAESLEEEIYFPLLELFSFEIEPYIEVDETVYQHYIDLKIRNPFEIDFPIREALITLQGQDESSTIIGFRSGAAVIQKLQLTVLRVYTNAFKAGAYVIGDLYVKLAPNILLCCEQLKARHSPDDTVVYNGGQKEEANPLEKEMKQVFHYYPSPSILRIEFQPPLIIELGSNMLETVVLNGPKKVRNLKIHISNPSFGLNFQKPSEVIQIDSIEPNGTARALFDLSSDGKLVDLVAHCTYESGEDHYQTDVYDWLDTNLLISISVQDIFRSSAIYAKFQLGCAQSRVPVKVNDCKFTCSNDKYEVLGLSLIANLHEPFLITEDQLAHVFYKLIPKSDNLDPSDSLDLSITHSNLQKDCEQLVKFALQRKFSESNILRYLMIAYSIVPLMEFDLDLFGVEEQVNVLNQPACKSAMFTRLSTHVAPEFREKLLTCFLSIFNDSMVEVSEAALQSVTKQVLHIPVAVPYLDMLHRVEFKIKEDTLYVVGESIEAKLIILSTSRWSSAKTGTVLASSSPKAASSKESHFEVSMVNEENWIMTGFSRQTFSVVDGYSVREVDVCLIPLNVGSLLFPRAEIKALDPSCAIDVVHENASETIFVTPDLKSVTLTF